MNCEEVRNRIAQMPVGELETADRDGHLASCPDCRSYWQDMLLLSSSLQGLTIPRPASMQPPAAAATPFRRVRAMTLMAATFAILLVGALLAAMYSHYFVAEDSDGPGTRESLLYNSRTQTPKKVMTPQNGQLEREQSKSSPSTPSRN